MRLELIQPFINATDAVLSEMLNCPAKVASVNMAEEVYRRKGVAARATIHGDIEGRIIFDLEPETALQIAAVLAGTQGQATEETVRETVYELANMAVGNAVTLLNDRGFHFKVLPPEFHAAETGYATGSESEALVMCFEGSTLNVALAYSRGHSAFGMPRPRSGNDAGQAYGENHD